MTVPGAIGPSDSAYLAYQASLASSHDAAGIPDPSGYADTYDLNRDGVVTPEEVYRRDLAGRTDTASSLPFVHTGPALLHLDEGWIPQGQGYDAQRDELLTSYYTDTNGNGHGDTVRLSVQDRTTGVEARDVVLLGLEADGSDRPAHGGGVQTYGDYILVADTQQVYVYHRDKVDNPVWNPDTGRYEVAAEHVMEMPAVPEEYRGQVVPDPEDDPSYQSPASYLAVDGDTLYVGSYSKDKDDLSGGVYRFNLNPETGAISEPTGFIKAPDQSQGLTVVEGGLLFSSGHKENKLVYQPLGEGEAFTADPGDRTVYDSGERIGSYAQGITIIDGELYVTYESGADEYGGDGPKSIQRIALDDLGIAHLE